ncbi:hypothetical protein N7527_006825 [Penicillium freii]|nr:hypothetical protein N7527_006825 [Penicillium freii]
MDEAKPRSPGAPAARVHPDGCFTVDDSAVSQRNAHWPISRASNSWLQAIIYGFARSNPYIP